MDVTVQLFARARDLAGASVVQVPVGADATVAELRRQLAIVAPALQPIAARLHIAVNSQYASPDTRLPAGAEVACFPPVSGG